jgi:Fic family protein
VSVYTAIPRAAADRLGQCLDALEKFLHVQEPQLPPRSRSITRAASVSQSVFKARRVDYYRLLQEVRENGPWEAWMEYFLIGVRDMATQAVATAREIMTLFDRDRATIETLGRSSASVFRVHDLLQRRAIVTIQAASKELKLSLPTVGKSLEHLIKLGIVHVLTGKQRRRVFAYSKYLAVLDQGTEPLPS